MTSETPLSDICVVRIPPLPPHPPFNVQQRKKPIPARVSAIFRSATRNVCCGTKNPKSPIKQGLVALLHFQTLPQGREGKTTTLEKYGLGLHHSPFFARSASKFSPPPHPR